MSWSIYRTDITKWWHSDRPHWRDVASRWSTFHAACMEVTQGIPPLVDVRIVPSPPLEMTDEECIDWVSKKEVRLYTPAHMGRGYWTVESGQVVGQGPTIFGAIRACRDTEGS